MRRDDGYVEMLIMTGLVAALVVLIFAFAIDRGGTVTGEVPDEIKTTDQDFVLVSDVTGTMEYGSREFDLTDEEHNLAHAKMMEKYCERCDAVRIRSGESVSEWERGILGSSELCKDRVCCYYVDTRTHPFLAFTVEATRGIYIDIQGAVCDVEPPHHLTCKYVNVKNGILYDRSIKDKFAVHVGGDAVDTRCVPWTYLKLCVTKDDGARYELRLFKAW